MSDGPRVTVIVPAFNATATLRATMASVTGQSHRDLEIFIIDDGSTDCTAALADEIAAADGRVTVIRQVNGGVARARNAALARATGEYVSWIDADDLWRPEKIERQLGVFAASAAPLAFVYSGYRLIDEDDLILANRRPLVDVSGWTVCEQIATNFFSNVSSIMVPTGLAQELGGHDPILRDEGIEGAEDLLLQLRLALRGPAGCLRSATVGYRMHAANMSRGHARAARSNLRALALVEAEAGGSVPDWVFRMGRARVVGYAAHCLRVGEGGAAVRLIADLMREQPWETVVMAGRVLGLAAREAVKGVGRADPAVGMGFEQADLESALWGRHMLLSETQAARLKAADAARWRAAPRIQA